MWSKRQEDQEAVTDWNAAERRQRANTKPKGGCRRSSQDGRELRDAGDLRQQAGDRTASAGRRRATNKLLTMLRGSTTTAKGFDEDGNDAGLILPMILLCNDGTSSSA
ncbi:hypothetical protein ERJ75_000900400 [Trypanosoma vivax]|nr:hypothetical protein ERJ75_000900400 [Trypanosoma vivax]